MVKLPGGGLGTGRGYQGEQLQPVAKEFLQSVRAGTVDDFMLAHPELINREK